MMPEHISDPLNSSELALRTAVQHAEVYLSDLYRRQVAPTPEALEALALLGGPMPKAGTNPQEVINTMATIGGPATMATAGGRYFGLVVGGSLPATVGTRVLNAAWDQLASSQSTSPLITRIEQITSQWLLELFGLPEDCSVGYVSGTTMGNFLCLAAARHEILMKYGWNVEKQGLRGSPQIQIVASAEIHVTVKKVLSMLGLGTADVVYVKTDQNGGMDVADLPVLGPNSIVLAQAGNVNTGAIDPIGKLGDITEQAGAWLHVDGAFGLWAAASENTRHWLKGYEKANSWVTDGHKWLNTPYDGAMAICRSPHAIHQAMATQAPYLVSGHAVEPKDMVPELSRGARALDVWAALKSLGKDGVALLVDRCCQHARLAARLLDDMGFEVLNDVVLNQVLVSHAESTKLSQLVELVCQSGEAWFGLSRWRGVDAFRLSFSSWVTQEQDVLRLLQAIEQASIQLGMSKQ